MPKLPPPEETRFKPGQSGNPKGRPPGIPNARTRYLRLLTLTEKIKNPVTDEMEEFSIMEQLDMQIIAKARRGDISAYKEIMDRLEGKPQQTVDMNHGIDSAAILLQEYGIIKGKNDDRKDDGAVQSPSKS